jgi:hypothetical protein
MKAESTVALVKELEKIRSVRARNSYTGAWFGFVFSILWLGSIHWASAETPPNGGAEWLPAVMLICALAVCLQSFYVIIRHLVNKKFAIIIEAVIDNAKKD